MSESLTTETISKKKGNRFDLVNYVIDVAENIIETGRAPQVRTKSLNPAVQALEEVSKGKEILAEISSEEEIVSVSTEEVVEQEAPVK